VREQTKYVIAVTAATIVGLAAITYQSLWIDEGAAALKAMQPTLHDWWQDLRVEGGSNLQLLFQLFYLWGWEKIFGSSEVTLRASNIPWFAAAAAAMLWCFPRNAQLQLSVLLLTLTNAFLWYYLSEARPYIVLFAFSALTTACLLRLAQDETSSSSSVWFHLFCVGLVGLCATSLIAVPWAAAAIGAFAFWSGPHLALRAAKRFARSSALAICSVLALGFYYLWTIRLGARASNAAETGFATLGLIFYELLGIAGLGPSRLTFREEGMRAVANYGLPLGLGVIAVFSLGAAAVVGLRKKATWRDFIFFGIAIVLPLIAVMLAGGAAHMRLLGRHFTPLLPFLLAFLGFGLAQLLFASRGWIRAVAVAAIVTLLISALEIRFAPRHQRDDYRTAAGEARRAIADGEKVWWAADVSTGAYYGIPLNSPDLTLGSNLSDRFFETLPTPDLVCLSKPDIYDPNDKIRNYLRAHDFKVMRVLPAFQIFQRQPDRH
jgi:hypothetical protein